MCKLRPEEFGYRDAPPLVLDEQVLTGGEAADTSGKARQKGCVIDMNCGLLCDYLHDSQ